jgi:hypothetical protein
MLLQAWREGDNQALERLVPLVRTEIHRLAGRYMKRERPGHPPPDQRLGQRGLPAADRLEGRKLAQPRISWAWRRS